MPRLPDGAGFRLGHLRGGHPGQVQPDEGGGPQDSGRPDHRREQLPEGGPRGRGHLQQRGYHGDPLHVVLEDFPLSPFLTKELSAFLLFIWLLTSSLFDITMKKRVFEF